VNDFQGRIREVTRRMMATVSELSMYQATAMKLQQEKYGKKSELEEAEWRLAHGKPPTDGAEQEWYDLERTQLARAEARMAHASVLRAMDNSSASSLAVRTTAEPRPNAYIPDDLGIPRPYGNLAPFKPSEPGTTIRHIRVPIRAEIEI